MLSMCWIHLYVSTVHIPKRSRMTCRAIYDMFPQVWQKKSSYVRQSILRFYSGHWVLKPIRCFVKLIFHLLPNRQRFKYTKLCSILFLFVYVWECCKTVKGVPCDKWKRFGAYIVPFVMRAIYSIRIAQSVVDALDPIVCHEFVRKFLVKTLYRFIASGGLCIFMMSYTYRILLKKLKGVSVELYVIHQNFAVFDWITHFLNCVSCDFKYCHIFWL